MSTTVLTSEEEFGADEGAGDRRARLGAGPGVEASDFRTAFFGRRRLFAVFVCQAFDLKFLRHSKKRVKIFLRDVDFTMVHEVQNGGEVAKRDAP